MKSVRLGNISTRLKTLQAKAPYRGIVKLPAEPVVIIYKKYQFSFKKISVQFKEGFLLELRSDSTHITSHIIHKNKASYEDTLHRRLYLSVYDFNRYYDLALSEFQNERENKMINGIISSLPAIIRSDA